MKRNLVLIAALLVAGCTTLVPPSRTLRVLTYNIHAGKDADQADNLTRVAAVIDSVDADIVLLQEVDRRTERSGRVDHFAELRRLTGLQGVFGKSLDYQGGEYGIAVLARWPIDSVQVLPLQVEPPQERAGGAHEPRIALHVRVHAPGGPIEVVNTHLDAAGTGTYRKQELVGVLAHMKQKTTPAAPLLFGGDLNARPTTDDINAVAFALTDAFGSCGSGAGETFPANAPDRRIDYVFMRGVRCTVARVIETQASDHRPLLAIIQISRGQ